MKGYCCLRSPNLIQQLAGEHEVAGLQTARQQTVVTDAVEA